MRDPSHSHVKISLRYTVLAKRSACLEVFLATEHPFQLRVGLALAEVFYSDCIQKPCCEASFNAKFPTARALEESQRAPWIHENDRNGASAKQMEKVKDCTWDLWLTGTTATGTCGGLQSHQRAQGRASSWELHGSQMADWADCLKSFKNSCEAKQSRSRPWTFLRWVWVPSILFPWLRTENSVHFQAIFRAWVLSPCRTHSLSVPKLLVSGPF